MPYFAPTPEEEQGVVYWVYSAAHNGTADTLLAVLGGGRYTLSYQDMEILTGDWRTCYNFFYNELFVDDYDYVEFFEGR